MLWAKKKTSFTRIRRLIEQFDTVAGLFLFKQLGTTKSKTEKLLMTTWPGHGIALITFAVSTIVITNFALISFILSIATLSIATTLHVTIIGMIRNKGTLKDLLGWCESLYDVEKYFSKRVQKIAEPHLTKLEGQTLKLLKLLSNVMYADAICITIGLATIGMFLPEKIYPKFSLPILLYLPFKKQNTWHAFITTLLIQTKVCIDSASLITFIFGIFFCIVIHTLGFLNIVKEFVQNMKHDLQTINGGHKNTEVVYEESIKIITEMLCNVNSVIGSFSKLYTNFFLLLEMSSLCSLFLCGLTFTVVHQQYAFAIGITFPTVLLFLICLTNEMFLERLDDIKEALYDIPWYELAPKQRKILLIVLNCDRIQGGFSAAGIHDLSMERFGIVVRAGYTNMLVLKDLVQK